VRRKNGCASRLPARISQVFFCAHPFAITGS
jgi:hypothetical protein